MLVQKKPILLLNGPNLNMLGQRDPVQYGRFTLSDVEVLTRETVQSYGFCLSSYQTNHEGAMIDQIQQSLGQVAGILINAGAWTHYSYALRDALELCTCPIMEVHISDIRQREPFRRISVIEPVCSEQVAGHGIDSYRIAARQLCRMLLEETHDGP